MVRGLVDRSQRAMRSHPRGPVPAPTFRADTVVHAREPVRIVFLLDLRQASIVAAPVRLLKPLLEVVALAHVRSAVRSNFTEFIHASSDTGGCFGSFFHRRLVTGNSWIGGLLAVDDNGQC